MKRINVIGTTGSGKSTFSQALSDALGIPYVQLDALFWKANWVESTDAEFFPKVTAEVNKDAWVLDGNFSRTTAIKWQRADTVIWLDFSYLTTFTQLFKRTVKRAISKQELWPNTGNSESFKKSFFDKSSILWWFFQNYHANRKTYLSAMQSIENPSESANKEYPHLTFIRLTNRKEAQAFLEKIKNTPPQQ